MFDLNLTSTFTCFKRFIHILTFSCFQAVIKNKLVAPLLKVIFPIMCENSDEEEDNDEDDEIETQKPALVAAQVSVLQIPQGSCSCNIRIVVHLLFLLSLV